MNLLITGAWQDAKQHFDSLREMGHQIHFQQYEKDPLTVDEEWIEGIICNGFFLYHDIRRFKHLRYIQLTSAGYDRVPMKYVEDHQIEIHNARGVYSIKMDEWAVMNILNIYKNTAHFFENQKKRTNAQSIACPHKSRKQYAFAGAADRAQHFGRRRVLRRQRFAFGFVGKRYDNGFDIYIDIIKTISIISSF